MRGQFNARLWKVKICTVVCLTLSTYLQFSIVWHQWHLISHREQMKFQSCKATSPSDNSNWGREFFCQCGYFLFFNYLYHNHMLKSLTNFEKCDASGRLTLQGLWNITRQHLKQFIFLTTIVVTDYSDSFRNLFRNPWSINGEILIAVSGNPLG